MGGASREPIFILHGGPEGDPSHGSQASRDVFRMICLANQTKSGFAGATWVPGRTLLTSAADVPTPVPVVNIYKALPKKRKESGVKLFSPSRGGSADDARGSECGQREEYALADRILGARTWLGLVQ